MFYRKEFLFFAFLLIAISTFSAYSASELKHIRRVYLSCHAFSWLCQPADDPNLSRWESWPGRGAMIKPYEAERRLRILELLRQANMDEALMIIPSWYPSQACPKTETDLIAFGKQCFGPRCVVTNASAGVLKKQLGIEFEESLSRDRATALKIRNADEAFESEFLAWTFAKAWITDLHAQLKKNGYDFDPSNVEFVCFGGDWRGCAASYPIMIGRVLELARPIDRRWDLITHDETPMDIQASLVVQNVVLPNNIRLTIFKTTQGRYCAEYWEGMHGPMDQPHQVTLDFPSDCVRLLNASGTRLITYDQKYGKVSVPVGCGGHTANKELIVELLGGISLDEFSKICMSGIITSKTSQADANQ